MFYPKNRKNIILTIVFVLIIGSLAATVSILYETRNALGLATQKISEQAANINKIEEANRQTKESLSNIVDIEIKLRDALSQRDAFALQAKACGDVKETLLKKGIVK